MKELTTKGATSKIITHECKTIISLRVQFCYIFYYEMHGLEYVFVNWVCAIKHKKDLRKEITGQSAYNNQ